MKAPAWHWIYIGLVGINAFIVGTCLYFSHLTMAAYSGSVLKTQRLTATQLALIHLQQKAADVDRPGNAVFETHDVDGEVQSFAAQKSSFLQGLSAAEDQIQQDLLKSDWAPLHERFMGVQDKLGALSASTDMVFAHYRAGNHAEASRAMAQMDARYSELSMLLYQAIESLWASDQIQLAEQLGNAQQLRSRELWVAAIMTLLLMATAAYGYVLSKQLKKESSEHQARESYLRTVVDNAQDAILTLDSQGVIGSFNPAAERIFGYSRAEILGKNVELIIPAAQLLHDAQPQASDVLYAHGRGTGQEALGKRKDGSSFALELSIGAFATAAREKEFVTSIRDITQRKQNEQKMLDNANELKNARDEAERATRLKSEFLANMSHEIRTPMNGIIGMSNLLLDCSLPNTERHYAETINRSADALLQIINDILDFSKIEAGKIELESMPFDLRDLCEEIGEMMALRTSEKGVELLLRYAVGCPTHVIGDPGRVRQIILNLLGNAIKFTDHGHVQMIITAQSASGGQIRFHVEVEDTGIGIPEDKIGRIFSKFSQADGSTTRKYGGTGLGLSISKELSRLMGGDMGVRSAAGVGSTFWFEMVLREDKEGVRSPLPKLDMLRGLRILVVDDNEVARTIVREQMSACGASVFAATSAKDALAMLSAGPRFDIAVLDFMMPEMNGMDLGRRLKSSPATADMDLIMCTSAPSRADQQLAEQLGFVGYFSKPVAQRHLRGAIALVVETRRGGGKLTMLTPQDLKSDRTVRPMLGQSKLKFSKVHILLAEDNAINQQVASILLQKYGCRVTPTGNGVEAVNQIKQQSFDLILMDCQMPEMDGYAATQRIRQIEQLQHRTRTPIVALTANAIKGEDEKCFAAGMDGFITKPIVRADLERALLTWLPASKREEATPAAADPPEPKSLPDSEVPILHKETFTEFCALLESEARQSLELHFETVTKYIRSIAEFFAKADYQGMATGAHPLKSSNESIGLRRLAHLAEQIEHHCCAAVVDEPLLRSWLAELPTACQQAQRAVWAQLPQ